MTGQGQFAVAQADRFDRHRRNDILGVFGRDGHQGDHFFLVAVPADVQVSRGGFLTDPADEPVQRDGEQAGPQVGDLQGQHVRLFGQRDLQFAGDDGVPSAVLIADGGQQFAVADGDPRVAGTAGEQSRELGRQFLGQPSVDLTLAKAGVPRPPPGGVLGQLMDLAPHLLPQRRGPLGGSGPGDFGIKLGDVSGLTHRPPSDDAQDQTGHDHDPGDSRDPSSHACFGGGGIWERGPKHPPSVGQTIKILTPSAASHANAA